ncbi:response regulator transcription factor [Chryseobacterium sp. WG14]|uniref:response regulator n=1 Tax=unclassified Chryseobacterium TaxID=2593645 RepID=UPI001D790DEA|nr:MULTISPECIES: response regulator transcription factor [unclassified Chryseobacterium]MCQ9637640.1 response regulator transcription factor [Chryseobacterium sp. WG23]MCQ9639418.1 response regulator transcription factor [Chryseobacterium sp. WG14]CAH0211281.1 Oxygen regulatory protein NreC [Chryseobacterium sp. Bi04]
MNERILIADDHYVVRAGTALVLESAYPELKIDFAENYERVKEALKSQYYNLLILDIDMPGTQYKKMISELKNIQKDLKILVFSGYDQDVAIQYIREGAEGYLNKQSSEEEIKNAVKTVIEKGYFYPVELIGLIIQNKRDNPVEKLSSREYEIFKLLADGYGNLEISNKLSIQMSTVSTYKKRIFQKLEVSNIAELIKVYEMMH